MTSAELRAAHPDKSELWIRMHAEDPVRKHGPAPAAPLPRKRTKRMRGSRVPLTRNGGKWTEARFWQAVRSALRRGFRFWLPADIALKRARVAAKGPRGRKWLYRCAECDTLHLRKNVQIDHREPCGALTKFEHVAEFLARLTPEEPGAYQVLCLDCHGEKTGKERKRPRVVRVTRQP
jgi:hypothetical protein